jgi:formamidopyrimidine-DNA glycosylase
MPELPEVQTVVNTLRPAMLGRRIAAVDLKRADILLPFNCDLGYQLIGASIAAVDRRGKRIIFTLSDGNRFYIHLGMTGRLSMESPNAPLLPHTHLVIDFEPIRPRSAALYGPQLRFRDPRRFGGIWWLGRDIPADDNIGPEPLTIRSPRLAAALGRTQRAIKNVLLDQSVIAGLGNIYVDEALFRARIHPLAVSAQLRTEQVSTLNRAIKSTLRKAIAHRGSTLRDYFDANGDPGGFQKLHAVYGRAGDPCRSCRTPIERFVLGGRSTHVCPKCQPR